MLFTLFSFSSTGTPPLTWFFSIGTPSYYDATHYWTAWYDILKHLSMIYYDIWYKTEPLWKLLYSVILLHKFEGGGSPATWILGQSPVSSLLLFLVLLCLSLYQYTHSKYYNEQTTQICWSFWVVFMRKVEKGSFRIGS